jgi:hypothetical protein
MSTTADAVHFSGCRGLITLTDCVFEGMGDDGANFGFLYLIAEEKVSDDTVLARHNLNIPNLPTPGDRIEFTRRDSLIPYATGTVRSATTIPGTATHEIRFERPLPAEFRVGDLLANVSRAPRVRVRGCTVRGNRARGFLIPARDAIVEDCLFENTTGSGIAVMPESVFFFEGVGARNVTIRNNRFIDCAYTTGPAVEGALAVFAFFKDFAFPRVPGVHRDITIQGNAIRGARNSGIFVAGVDGLVLRDNTITGACEKPTRPEGHAAVYIMSSANVKASGNRIDPGSQGAGFKNAWKLGPGCDKETIYLDEKPGNAEN